MALAIVTATAIPAREFSNDACGIIFNIQLTGVYEIEIESVDGNPLDKEGKTIIKVASPDNQGFIPDEDYYVNIIPCDLYGGSPFDIPRRTCGAIFRRPSEH